MNHKIAFRVKDMESPVEIDIGKETFKKITKFCQEKYQKNMDEVIQEYQNVPNEQVLDSLQDYVNWKSWERR